MREGPAVTLIKQEARIRLVDAQHAAHDERVRQRDEPIGRGVGERAQQHGIHDAEHRRRSAEAERERQDGRDGEAARVGETSSGKAKRSHHDGNNTPTRSTRDSARAGRRGTGSGFKTREVRLKPDATCGFEKRI